MSALLQTAMANASLQSGHPPSPARSNKRLSSDRGRQRSSAIASETSKDSEDEYGYSDSDDDDDEMVDLATRPSTPSGFRTRDEEGDKSGRFVATRDPVSFKGFSVRWRILLTEVHTWG
jgi:hypothetical protein